MKKTLLLIALMAATITAAAQKYAGGDISMLKKFVDAGAVYNDKDGNAIQDPLVFFSQQGWNTMRVRLFVDPTKATADQKKEGVIQDLEYVKELGRQIKDAGLTFMLDFHYSDTWTDPGKHSTPAAWTSLSTEQLKTKIYEYTKDCLQQLNAAGATPDFIQTGNEITTGLLWNTGRIYAGGGAPTGGSWDNFAGYLANAVKACNEECPNAKIVIHTELHAPNDVPKFYNELAKYPEVKYNIIGLSYYPDFHGDLSVLDGVLNTLEAQHADKQIMIVETGYGFQWQLSGAKYDFTANYPLSEDGQQQFARDLIALLNEHPHVSGLYWWYPEYTLNGIVFKGGSEDWNKNFTSGYWNAALFHYKTGKALKALYELKNFVGDNTGISTISADKKDNAWYTLDGRRLSAKPQTGGLYIHRGGTYVVK